MDKILILGAEGMLGHKLIQLIKGYSIIGTVRGDARRTDKLPEIFGPSTIVGDVDALDFSRISSLIRELEPAVVINCIGIVRQRKESENRYLSVAINSFLPHKLAKLCSEVGSRLIHISTDCVFTGSTGHYQETDPSDASDLYGKSKYLGETDSSEASAITLRTSIIGRELKRPTHGLLEWFLAQRESTIRGFSGAIYSGFTTIELANIIQQTIDQHQSLHGLFQVASKPISKYDLLLLVKQAFELDIDIERDEEFQCDRSMVMNSFCKLTGYTAPGWEKMIRALSIDPTPYNEWLA